MTTAALIVAAGRGLRAGGDMAKQWRQLAGVPLVEHALKAFADTPEIDAIVLVLHGRDMHHRAGFEAAGYLVARGGESRSASVRNGLALLEKTGVDKVLIHDSARPCITSALIRDVLAALDKAQAAAPAVAVTDALWSGQDGKVSGTRDRAGLFRAQTPQGFDFKAIYAAYADFDADAADDVEVARAAGLEVVIVPGDEDNLKVTMPGDFARAQRILEARMQSSPGVRPDIRVGNGFDVHRFGPGDHVTLCGVAVPHGRALQGHSDADVGLHALSDAIYGALAQGDIGRHFPPSDPQWNGADSRIFLSHAAGMARDMGFAISNADITLICEVPRITPHAEAMRGVLGDIIEVDVARISVKATTSERLGFTGREEGIAALATVTLVKP
jgi:2-C-methyl-D-erythritol 4-phosphate cytidylyltransferase / 2-C-methyl-D-erythritol 2,4-cyclodiphosphate synthase